MSIPTRTPPPPAEIVYPDSDGQPMAENTLQFEWIVTIKEGLETVFRDRGDVFVAGDLLWYPVEGDPTIRTAPDALVAFDRPKGYRGSYMQWREGGIAPHVVFEVLFPGNRAGEMQRKLQFYETYGVEEYYIYDPDDVWLRGYQRVGGHLRPIPELNGWISPRLGVRFELTDEMLRLYGPDGRPFVTYAELARQRDEAELRAELERQRTEEVERRAEEVERRAEEVERRAETERQRAETERQRAERLAERLRALGLDPEEP